MKFYWDNLGSTEQVVLKGKCCPSNDIIKKAKNQKTKNPAIYC